MSDDFENEYEEMMMMMLEEREADEDTDFYDSDDDYESGTDCDSELSDDELEIAVENIFDREERFLDEDKVNGCYYIGLPCRKTSSREWIMQIAIQPKTFLSNTINHVTSYLIDYSVTRIHNPTIHIMKLDVSNTGAYNVVLKTHWLRLVQRTWKRVFNERRQFINNCKKPTSILFRQTHRQWKNNTHLPGLTGMLRS